MQQLPPDEQDSVTLAATGEAVARPLALTVLLRRASGLSAATLVTSALAIPASFLVARWLAPTTYGRAQVVLLVWSYAALLRTGIFEAGTRAYIHHASLGETAAAAKAQNVAVSFETVASVVPGLVLLAGAFLFHDSVRRVGFAVAPIGVVAASLSTYAGGLYVARERFDIVAKANLIRAVLGTALLLAGVPLIGGVALFIAPAMADVVNVGFLATRHPRLELRLDFDFERVRPLLRAGLPLGALPVVYWVYRLVGSTSVAIGTTATKYGIYAFAAAPVGIVAGAVAGLHAVLIPAVWGQMATADPEDPRWLKDANRVTIGLALVAGVATNLAQAAFKPVVEIAVPRFRPAIPIFEILSLNILLLSVAAVPSLVLTSTRVNRQARYLAVWTAALVVNAGTNVAVLAAGLGSLAIAVDDIWIQVVVVVVIFWFGWPYLGGSRAQGRAVIVAAGLAVLTAGVGGVLHLLPVASSLSVAWATWSAARVVIVGAVWAVVVAAVRQSFRDSSASR